MSDSKMLHEHVYVNVVSTCDSVVVVGGLWTSRRETGSRDSHTGNALMLKRRRLTDFNFLWADTRVSSSEDLSIADLCGLARQDVLCNIFRNLRLLQNAKRTTEVRVWEGPVSPKDVCLRFFFLFIAKTKYRETENNETVFHLCNRPGTAAACREVLGTK